MKRGSTKKASKSKPSKKVFFDEGKLMALTLGVFILLAVVVPFINISQSNVTGHGVSGINLNNDTATKIGSFFANFIDPTQADATVLKWVVFFTFVIVLWALISWIVPKEKSKGIWRILALPVAFAMVYLLKADEIFAGLIGYSALGMTLIVVAPLIGIIFFSVKFLEGRQTPWKIISQLIIWYFYMAFMIYFLIRAFFAQETYSIWVLLIMGVGIGFSVWVVIANKKWRGWIRKLDLEGLSHEAKKQETVRTEREKGAAERAKQDLEGMGYK